MQQLRCLSQGQTGNVALSSIRSLCRNPGDISRHNFENYPLVGCLVAKEDVGFLPISAWEDWVSSNCCTRPFILRKESTENPSNLDFGSITCPRPWPNFDGRAYSSEKETLTLDWRWERGSPSGIRDSVRAPDFALLEFSQ